MEVGVMQRLQLTHELQETVKQCSERFTGRMELATELDTRVVKLCKVLEDVFCHGIRRTSSFKRITSPSQEEALHLLWQFISTILNRHEAERFLNLKNIHTDPGRVRSWIRSTLNENSLSRYLDIVFHAPQTLKFYEEWAYLVNPQTQSTLLESANTLSNLLFAVNIDKAELNSSPTSSRSNSRSDVVDPLPVFPQRETPKSISSKKLSPRVVSLGDDDGDGDGDVTPPIFPTQPKGQLLLTPLDEPDYSIEDGELGASTEEATGSHPSSFNEQRESHFFSKLIADKDFLDKKLAQQQQIIESLEKENELLKFQVKKYLSAIQMVTNKDQKDNPEVTPYRDAEEYEKKLVQVAEMHGELVEFNERLHKVILQKDAIIRRLREELTDLRGPLPEAVEVGELDEISFVSDASTVQTIPSSLTRPLVNIWIPTAFLSGQQRPTSHHLYQIYVRIKEEEWNVYRRYSQFLELHRKMSKTIPAVAGLDFPPKKTFSNRDARVVQERRKRLENYLRSLVNLLACENDINDRRSLVALIPFLGVGENGRSSETSTSQPAQRQYLGL